MPTYLKKYTSRNKENGQMIKKDIRMETEKGAVVYQVKGCIFGNALPNELHWTLSATKTNTVVAKIKYDFWLPLFQMFQLLYYRRKCNGIFKTGRAFLITLSPEKHK